MIIIIININNNNHLASLGHYERMYLTTQAGYRSSVVEPFVNWSTFSQFRDSHKQQPPSLFAEVQLLGLGKD